jgi:hypothetical protein
VSYGSLTWRTGNSKTLPLGLCSSFWPYHAVCRTRFLHWFKLLLMTALIAPSLLILKTLVIHPMSSILSPPQKASPSVMQRRLLPPPWRSCSQATAAQPPPPPWPSCSSQAGTTLAVTTPATLIPLGLTTGKATGQVIGHRTATLTGPATTQATLTALGLIPGRATEDKGSSLDVYNLVTDEGQVSQGSGGSSSSSKG